jgi:two-component system chemotaxis response regulator CheB
VTKLLVVDDSALMRRVLGEVFQNEDGFEVAFARDGVEALEQVHAFKPDVITLDVQMPRMDGLSCLDRIMVERPCPVVMVSSLTAEGADATLEALELGRGRFRRQAQRRGVAGHRRFRPLLVERVRWRRRRACGARTVWPSVCERSGRPCRTETVARFQGGDSRGGPPQREVRPAW